MSNSTTRKRGDTAPDLVITCYDGDVPLDLSGATARLIISRAGEVIVDEALIGTAQGTVTHTLTADETDAVATLRVEVEVTWPDGTVQTFPAVGYLTVNVIGDLG